jgi:hypothetical protein
MNSKLVPPPLAVCAVGFARASSGRLFTLEEPRRDLCFDPQSAQPLPIRVQRYLIPGMAPAIQLAGYALKLYADTTSLITVCDQAPLFVLPLPPGQMRYTGAQVLQGMPTNLLGLISQAYTYEGEGFHLTLSSNAVVGALCVVRRAQDLGRCLMIVSRPDASEAACLICSSHGATEPVEFPASGPRLLDGIRTIFDRQSGSFAPGS